jgi:hypothetical protein
MVLFTDKDYPIMFKVLNERIFELFGGDKNKPIESAVKLLEKQEKIIKMLSFTNSFEKDNLIALKKLFRSELRGDQKRFIIKLTSLKPINKYLLRQELKKVKNLASLKRDVLKNIEVKFPKIKQIIDIKYLRKTKSYQMFVNFSLLKKMLVNNPD